MWYVYIVGKYFLYQTHYSHFISKQVHAFFLQVLLFSDSSAVCECSLSAGNIQPKTGIILIFTVTKENSHSRVSKKKKMDYAYSWLGKIHFSGNAEGAERVLILHSIIKLW